MGSAPPEWDISYTVGAPTPEDIGRPQPPFARFADEGRLSRRLPDADCGAGENGLLAASRGADVTRIVIALGSALVQPETAVGVAAGFPFVLELDKTRSPVGHIWAHRRASASAPDVPRLAGQPVAAAGARPRSTRAAWPAEAVSPPVRTSVRARW
jgi:hypothetical protein